MIDIASISSLVRVSTKALELNGCEGAHVCNDAWGSTSTTTRTALSIWRYLEYLDPGSLPNALFADMRSIGRSTKQLRAKEASESLNHASSPLALNCTHRATSEYVSNTSSAMAWRG